MKLIEFFQLPPINTTKEIYDLQSLIEDQIEEDDFWSLSLSNNQYVELKYYIYEEVQDHFVHLFSVWYKDQPVMVCELSGYNKGHSKRYISKQAESTFEEMIDYLKSLSPEIEKTQIKTFYENEDIVLFGSFPEGHYTRFYDPSFIPEYKVGDIVEGWVIANPFAKWNDKNKDLMIQRRVKIQATQNMKPNSTYYAVEVDRKQVGTFNSKNDRKIIDRINGDNIEDTIGGIIHLRLNKDLKKI